MSSTEGPACPVELAPGLSSHSGVLEKHQTALLLLLGFGSCSVIITLIYNALRRHIFKDKHSLDIVFDAGGRVSLSLTAASVTSQLLWPADFLQNSTLLIKSGIGGSLWYSVAIVIVILLFPLLSLNLKTRAPGAKTFPQIGHVRFGKPVHILFCILGLSTNLIITCNLLLGGKSAIQVVTKDVSTEFIMLLLASLCGSYCIIGGLGTTYYISYFNTAIIFICVSVFVLKANYFTSSEMSAFDSKEAMYEAMVCIRGPEGNFENSLLTFRTRSGILYGIVIFFMTMSVAFCDQSNWQSRIAAKPAEGVVGFLIAAFLWFAIPTTVSFHAAMTYMSLSFQNGTHVLQSADIDHGHITPYVMDVVLGPTGGYLMITILMMAYMSTGHAQIMSASSIIIYDIYKTYIRPFRRGLSPTACVLCGKDKAKHECSCPSSVDCDDCIKDVKRSHQKKTEYGIRYACKVHGLYRHYEDTLIEHRSWCMVWIIILIVPLGLVISETQMDLNWAFLVGQSFTSSFLVPLFLSLTWAKTTAKGVIAGVVVGTAGSITGMLVVGSTYEGGLSDFYVNTAKDYSLISALIGGISTGSVVCIITSLCTTTVKTTKDEAAEWEKTMSIDNPLNPYRSTYAEELDAINAGSVISADEMAKVFKLTHKVACIVGIVSLGLFLVVIPAVLLSIDILSFGQFETLLTVFHAWCFVGTALVVIVPPVEECIQIFKQYRKTRAMTIQQNYRHNTFTMTE